MSTILDPFYASLIGLGRAPRRPDVKGNSLPPTKDFFQNRTALSFGRHFSSNKRNKLRIDSERFPELKRYWRLKFDEVRQRFRLTPTERRVALFVAAAFGLGLITKCYRDAHPSPTPVQIHPGSSRTSASRAKVDQPGAPHTGEATKRTRKSAEKLDLSDSATKQEHQQK